MQEIQEESNVGKILSDKTTERVITIVVVMLFSIPLFSSDTWTTENNSYSVGLNMISSMQLNSDQFDSTFDAYVEVENALNNPLILIIANGVIWESGINVQIYYILLILDR